MLCVCLCMKRTEPHAHVCVGCFRWIRYSSPFQASSIYVTAGPPSFRPDPEKWNIPQKNQNEKVAQPLQVEMDQRDILLDSVTIPQACILGNVSTSTPTFHRGQLCLGITRCSRWPLRRCRGAECTALPCWHLDLFIFLRFSVHQKQLATEKWEMPGSLAWTRRGRRVSLSHRGREWWKVQQGPPKKTYNKFRNGICIFERVFVSVCVWGREGANDPWAGRSVLVSGMKILSVQNVTAIPVKFFFVVVMLAHGRTARREIYCLSLPSSEQSWTVNNAALMMCSCAVQTRTTRTENNFLLKTKDVAEDNIHWQLLCLSIWLCIKSMAVKLIC